MMQDIETKLDELFVKKAPYQIPKEGREGLVKAMPWVTVVGGVLMLFAAWALWNLVSAVSSGLGWLNNLSMSYSTGVVAPALTPLVWISVVLLTVEAVMFFIAYPGLGLRKKSAWNLLYYVTLLNAAQAVVQFIGYTNVGTLIGSLLATAIGLYILFQIRGYYTGDAAPASGGKTPEPTKK